ncbi:PREDICTED: seipin [Trachymyrmex cornetzi]|uniref:Seipin n=1 Tax=Trachymyrmex cornetzi TaxID=471704 RepID=A0A151J9A0_9HYME|nr:PREDICTED: seipin [Trachymyrmex cornetzi]XP_018360786.1 PREDICTED: seipin [Trachymyrmex cornetzi]KYN21597.1 Seipin [Trachymyrmex cornetzi]
MLISRLLRKIGRKWFNIRKTTRQSVQSAKDTVFRSGVVIVTTVLIVWLSIFLYTVFYYSYMPSMTYVRPVHLQFKSCDEKIGICSFPQAHVQLTKRQQLLMVGQPYKMNLHLEMPESTANKELGMFMVCAQLRSRDGHLVDHMCKSAMLHYRSTLLHTLTTLLFSPMMIFGNVEEKQDIVLELFNNFEEDQNHPVTIIFIEVQSRHIEFYSANLIINARLSGLRYWMFYWPILSSCVGIGTNLFFIMLVCTLSYIHFGSDDENFNYEKSEIEDDNDLKGDLSDTSSQEGTLSLTDLKSEEKSIEEEKLVMGESSYIEEISAIIAESSSSPLVK